MLHVVQEARSESLFDRLAEELAHSAPGPAGREIVIVESVGMARRLPLELAARLGAVAGLHTPFPARFIWEELLHPGAAEATSPWEVGALAWRLAALLPGCLDGPGSESAARLLAEDPDGRLRHELARRLAGLFDQYLVQRPGWLLAWEDHPGAARLYAGDMPTGLPAAQSLLHWQRRLWRNLRDSSAQPHRASLQADWLQRLAEQGPPAGLPPRLSLFALSALPSAQTDCFDALSKHLPVTLYLLNPSRDYWGDLPGKRPRQAMEEAEGRAPLLAACGGELGVWIDDLIDRDAEFHGPTCEPAPPVTLLEHVQAGMFDISQLPAGIPADDSLQFHACHSPLRQVEVLLDCLLDLFQRDPTLCPGDVLVLCPELESVRPAFEAVFSSQDPAQRIPWRVLGPTAGQGLAAAVGELLELAGGRWESGRVLAPLNCAALRRRQGLAAEDLPQIHDWCRAAGIRWGWDAAARRELGLPALDEHGWRAGLDRLLLGYALSGDSPLAGVVPLPAAGEEPARLQAWLAWLLLLRRFEAEALSPRTPAGWARWLLGWLPRLLDPDEAEEREAQELREALLSLETQALSGRAEELLSLGAARDILRQALASDPGIRGGGFDGRLTLAPMMACRALPARVIALLGLEDGVFPRPSRRDELDLCLFAGRRGDRQPRLQDRALFLEALGCARRALLLFWTGHDQKENRKRPPSTVVSELLDWLGESAGRVREHALQPFSPAAFQAGAEPPGRHRGWNRAARRLALSRLAPETLQAHHPLLEELGLEEPSLALSLEDLERFFHNPARAFLRRAGIQLPWDGGPPAEEEPFASDPKALGGLRRLLLRWEEEALPENQLEPRLRAAGLLPWGHAGSSELERARRDVRELRQRASEALAGALPHPVRDIELSVGEFRLRARLEEPSSLRVECRSRKRDNAALAEAWLRHLAWSVDSPGGSTLLLFLDGELRLPPLPDPQALLAEWLDAWRTGQRSWLPWLPLISEVAAGECVKARLENREARLDLDLYQQRDYLWEDPWLQTTLGGADPFTHPEIAPRVQEWALRLGGPLREALS